MYLLLSESRAIDLTVSLLSREVILREEKKNTNKLIKEQAYFAIWSQFRKKTISLLEMIEAFRSLVDKDCPRLKEWLNSSVCFSANVFSVFSAALHFDVLYFVLHGILILYILLHSIFILFKLHVISHKFELYLTCLLFECTNLFSFNHWSYSLIFLSINISIISWGVIPF